MSESTTLTISLDRQTLELNRHGGILRSYPISSAEKGMGFQKESFRTPTGRFRIAEKIGQGEPRGTRFVAREPVGLWDENGKDRGDLILSRILRLDGLDPENGNTLDRYIYIHGTNHEKQIGTPCSHGCIRMCNSDVIELFDDVEVGDLVVIEKAVKKGPKLLFLDCDSTLSEIEGIDELARLSDPETFQEVVNLTNAAMNGEVPLDQVFKKRMEIIKPNKAMVDQVSDQYLATILPGAKEFVDKAVEMGWLPVILSGGFAPIIKPLADRLGISHLEAVPLFFDADGNYTGYGEDYPTTRNLGKNEIIREWKEALLPERVMMVGDGISDLETKSDVNLMAGFGVVAHRSRVEAESDIFVKSFDDLVPFLGS